MSVYALSNPLDIQAFNTGAYWCSACGHHWLTNDGRCHLCRAKDSHPVVNRPPVVFCKDCGMDDTTPGHETAPGH